MYEIKTEDVYEDLSRIKNCLISVIIRTNRNEYKRRFVEIINV